MRCQDVLPRTKEMKCPTSDTGDPVARGSTELLLMLRRRKASDLGTNSQGSSWKAARKESTGPSAESSS